MRVKDERTQSPADMQLTLKRLLTGGGASLVGFADISGLPLEGAYRYPTAISIAVALTPAVVAGIPTGPNMDYSDEYITRNMQLDTLGRAAVAYLDICGHPAHAITRDSVPYGEPAYQTALPHKTVARLAGLGWIGKSGTLVTPEYGNAVRLITVLTDAPLTTGTPVTESRCGSCTACRDACPAKAIKGQPYEIPPPGAEAALQARARVVDAPACAALLAARTAQRPGWHATCGMCVAMCPHTRAYLKKAKAI